MMSLVKAKWLSASSCLLLLFLVCNAADGTRLLPRHRRQAEDSGTTLTVQEDPTLTGDEEMTIPPTFDNDTATSLTSPTPTMASDGPPDEIPTSPPEVTTMQPAADVSTTSTSTTSTMTTIPSPVTTSSTPTVEQTTSTSTVSPEPTTQVPESTTSGEESTLIPTVGTETEAPETSPEPSVEPTTTSTEGPNQTTSTSTSTSTPTTTLSSGAPISSTTPATTTKEPTTVLAVQSQIYLMAAILAIILLGFLLVILSLHASVKNLRKRLKHVHRNNNGEGGGHQNPAYPMESPTHWAPHHSSIRQVSQAPTPPKRRLAPLARIPIDDDEVLGNSTEPKTELGRNSYTVNPPAPDFETFPIHARAEPTSFNERKGGY
ncbi:unnamed protein product [Cyprideis torosa]|uniref:Uncharacterized protein n=1 Tax=Cyprideis torosa TaxID=163714 RepID=A0A7R8W8N5_9CRUS|nr:unnamed protein product [Cyprideis torosa]CAG0884498.1 unnamed protein product [Cyprideis torosa]